MRPCGTLDRRQLSQRAAIVFQGLVQKHTNLQGRCVRSRLARTSSLWLVGIALVRRSRRASEGRENYDPRARGTIEQHAADEIVPGIFPGLHMALDPREIQLGLANQSRLPLLT